MDWIGRTGWILLRRLVLLEHLAMLRVLRRNWFNVSDTIECSEKFVWRKEARNTKVLPIANTGDERGR